MTNKCLHANKERMMVSTYRTTYKDQYGEEQSIFYLENGILTIQLRGISFVGKDFDELYATANQENYLAFDQPAAAKKGGRAWGWNGALTDCTFQIAFPIQMIHHDTVSSSSLTATLNIAIRERNGIICNRYHLQLTLKWAGKDYSTSNEYESFEPALCDLQRILPPEHILKCCLSCRHSHYSIYGNAPFGNLMCFKRVSPEPVFKDKDDLIDIDPEFFDQTEFVPELGICPEYTPMTEMDWAYKAWGAHLY